MRCMLRLAFDVVNGRAQQGLSPTEFTNKKGVTMCHGGCPGRCGRHCGDHSREQAKKLKEAFRRDEWGRN